MAIRPLPYPVRSLVPSRTRFANLRRSSNAVGDLGPAYPILAIGKYMSTDETTM